ncbi:MAG: Na/Pi cotransporter family protein [Solobacterium sp.]|nr:Na/Pi cotransporter family protein [Solobacterium sp.]
MSLYDTFTLLGGVGLFLYGMSLLSDGLKNACGERLKVLLEKATSNKLTAVVSGILVTVFIQSSSATDVMVIGFVTSGLMKLTQAVGVIMGANIGTTVTAQITAFNIGAIAPFILFIGAVICLFVKNRTIQYSGMVVLGFGMLFQGITLMKSAIIPLSETPAFIAFMSTLSNPFITVIFGVLFTALLQSSSSATVIFQAFAIQGLITYNTAVYLIIGAALGSVTPNLLAGLTANRAGKRCSVLNLLFNLIRAVFIFTLVTVFPQILNWITALSPGNIGRQIANTHTIFAIIAVLVLLPFSDYIVKLSEKLIPKDRSEKQREEDRRLMFMTQTENIPAALAADQAHREVTRMGELAIRNMNDAVQCFFEPDKNLRAKIEETEETVDWLSEAILDKLIEIRSLTSLPEVTDRVYHMIRDVDDLERISDHAINILRYQSQITDGSAVISEEGLKDLRELSNIALESLKFCLFVYKTKSVRERGAAEILEDRVDKMKDTVIQRHVQRLSVHTCDPRGGIILTDMAVDLERCSDHAINLVQSISKDAH